MQAQLDRVNPMVGTQELDRDLLVHDGGAARYQYSTIGRTCLRFVIVDVSPDGQEDFWEQEAGEPCWHSYYPCAAERTAFHGLAAEKGTSGGWPLLCLPQSGHECDETDDRWERQRP